MPSLAPVLSLIPFAEGFANPVDIASAGDDRLFVVEQAGRIRVVESDGRVRPTPFLDIVGRVNSDGNEQGLLGLAFHPGYASNGYFYVNYTNSAGDTVIARFQVSSDPNVANGQSEHLILGIDQPYANHNGGDLAFGPDGYFYIATGDGGGGGDPQNRAQNGGTLLGKVLRIDVDGGDPYAIPPTNPFVDNPAVLDEIWALGLRNPWRYSFDRETGDLYIGDVGQGAREEIDFQPASSNGGENYGWRLMEGTLCYNPTTNCNPGTLTLPITEYDHDLGYSVTGGYVYRGSRFPAMVGYYLFADYGTGRFWSLRRDGAGRWQRTEVGNFSGTYSSFGEDAQGELYVAGHTAGIIYHLQDTTPSHSLFLPIVIRR
ncbi:MAG: PQQ-dependent sugar dehydrogenase [Ardenticatenales bacterium]|nr:PQQ-dependent sugar dehydrogenase [Ardenticatenales bacterium]